jgi:hypothetical protein
MATPTASAQKRSWISPSTPSSRSVLPLLLVSGPYLFYSLARLVFVRPLASAINPSLPITMLATTTTQSLHSCFWFTFCSWPSLSLPLHTFPFGLLWYTSVLSILHFLPMTLLCFLKTFLPPCPSTSPFPSTSSFPSPFPFPSTSSTCFTMACLTIFFLIFRITLREFSLFGYFCCFWWTLSLLREVYPIASSVLYFITVRLAITIKYVAGPLWSRFCLDLKFHVQICAAEFWRRGFWFCMQFNWVIYSVQVYRIHCCLSPKSPF